MSGKLILLNLVLLGVLAYGAVTVRSRWQSEKAHQAAVLNHKVPAAPAPPVAATTPPPAVLPANYIDIPKNMLFDRSRNSEIAIEPPPPPPPPPPVPPLPIYHGQMTIGEPIIILSTSANAPGEGIKRGEPIGPFKLVDFNPSEITLEWNGQTIHKTVDEISGPSAPEPGPQPGADAGAAPAPPPVPKSALGPGEPTGTGISSCNPNDNSAEGAVMNGMRKVLKPGPFGVSCYWEPVH